MDISIIRDVLGHIPDIHKTRTHKKMTITPGGGKPITVPYAPREVTYSNLSASWDEIARTGRSPLVVRSGDPQPRMSFTLFFGTKDPLHDSNSTASQLRALANYARHSSRLKVDYSSWEHGLWRIASMSINAKQRHPYTNEITQAEVDIEFVLASDITTNLGPVTGGVQNPPSSPPPNHTSSGSGSSSPKRPKTYRVKKGDTLYKIAIRFYRDASKWRAIAKKNHIRNPRKLRVGQVLKLP